MNYTIINPPACEPVELIELKQFLRITHDSEDALLATLLRTAREWVEQETHHMLIERRILLPISFDLRNPKIRLMNGRTGVLMPIGPVRHVHHIHSVLVDEKKILLRRDQYQLNRNGQASLIILKVEDGVGMEIDCTVGYGPRAEEVPAFLRHMVLQWALHLYEHRGLAEPPLFSKMREWLGTYRKWRLR